MAAEQTIHLERYSPSAKALVSGAQSLADERKHALVEPIHLLVRALDRDKGVQDICRTPCSSSWAAPRRKPVRAR
jgi:ATP-dependent Clp protease ATP-binding subunit ClpB